MMNVILLVIDYLSSYTDMPIIAWRDLRRIWCVGGSHSHGMLLSSLALALAFFFAFLWSFPPKEGGYFGGKEVVRQRTKIWRETLNSKANGVESRTPKPKTKQAIRPSMVHHGDGDRCEPPSPPLP